MNLEDVAKAVEVGEGLKKENVIEDHRIPSFNKVEAKSKTYEYNGSREGKIFVRRDSGNNCMRIYAFTDHTFSVNMLYYLMIL